MKEPFKEEENVESKGYYTPLSEAQEFCCLVAALYGKKFEDKKFKILGSLDDEAITSRCAYYGNADLAVEEIEAAYAKDGATFTFAALYNENLYWGTKKRVALEDVLKGDLRFI